MQIYKDAEGREFPVELTGYEMKLLRKVGIELTTEEQLRRLEDVTFVGEVLLLICADDIEEKGLSEKQFLKGLKGEAAESAATAIARAFIDFFPKGQAEAMHKMFDQALKETEETSRKALETINADSAASSGDASSK